MIEKVCIIFIFRVFIFRILDPPLYNIGTNLNMAASKLFSDKKSEFADFAIPAMKIDSVLHQSERRLKPLIMEICNGGYPWSFTDGDAFIQYRKQKLTFNFDLWYMFSYKKLINVLARKEKHIANVDRLIFECLFDFLSGKSEIGIAQTMFGHK